MERPSYIDLSASSSRAASSADTRSAQPSPSPRIQHYDGDIPPILSPLDAFAAESRRLAKELEATRIAGERRMSRLPPAVITKSLSKHQASRPACFRTLSSNPDDITPPVPSREDSGLAGISPDVKEPSERPKSTYPRISAVVQDEDDAQDDVFETPREQNFTALPRDYFAIERTASPQPAQDQSSRSVSRTASATSQPHHLSTLLPPSAPFAKTKPSTESSDDGYTSSNAGSTFSHARKTSNSSGMSFPVSPALQGHHERSPSNKSDTSLSSVSRSKKGLNFSRPMSQASSSVLKLDSPTRPTNSLDRKPSHLSEGTRNLASFEDDRSVLSDGFVNRPTSSYTHKKFVLPRGKISEKAVQRVSALFSGLSGPTFGWNEPVFPGTPPLSARQENGNYFSPTSPSFRPSFDPGRPSLDPGRPSFDPKRSISAEQVTQAAPGFSFGFEGPQPRNIEQEERPSSSRTAPEPITPTTVTHKPSTAYIGPYFEPTLPTIPGSTADSMSLRSAHPTITSTSQSTNTIRPTRPSTARTNTDYQALSADDHVDQAIELHQAGSLKESTYHLRIAAKMNHPTGMLLYALACRHGWGMRANPSEGVLLLRKAVEMAQLEVAEDENSSSPRPKPNVIEQKSHRAQFALAIYELGISHLNGWGIEQDKALALRCFEIAGTWGDPDALTEAGFCYAEGIGCKKNLKKAAKFYRQAADKGVSMVGNSWIYKDKYNDDETTNENNNNDTTPSKRGGRSRAKSVSTAEDKKDKPRSKSKTRSIFGRKRGKTLTQEQDSGNIASLVQPPKMSIEA